MSDTKAIAYKFLAVNSIYLFCLYVSFEGLVKLLHEAGHALYALYLGYSLQSISIHLNPFAGAYVKIKRLHIESALDSALFSISGSALPVLLGILCYVIMHRFKKIKKFELSLLAAYSFVSVAVNLLAGFVTSYSDTKGILELKGSGIYIIVFSLLILIIGLNTIVKSFLVPCIKSYFTSTFEKFICIITLCAPSIIALLTSVFLHEGVRHRLLFTVIEIAFFLLCFFVAHKTGKTVAASPSIKIAKPFSFVCVSFGLIIALSFYVEYILYALN